MKRTVIKIDREKCTGCGICVEGCHEGALQLIDGKAVMISELYCDGLGACIGECPVGAIELEERESEPYSETAVMERLVIKGEKVILAHLRHLKDCKQWELLNEGIAFLKKNNSEIKLDEFERKEVAETPEVLPHTGCPGSKAMFFNHQEKKEEGGAPTISGSELQQWPVQLHLLSSQAPYLAGSDLLLAADCTAYALGDFHTRFLKGKRLAIACPKLDKNKEVYVEKLTAMINEAKINTLTVMIMEVPCCNGLLQIAQTAVSRAQRKIPVKLVVVGLQGDIVKEEWI